MNGEGGRESGEGVKGGRRGKEGGGEGEKESGRMQVSRYMYMWEEEREGGRERRERGVELLWHYDGMHLTSLSSFPLPLLPISTFILFPLFF